MACIDEGGNFESTVPIQTLGVELSRSHSPIVCSANIWDSVVTLRVQFRYLYMTIDSNCYWGAPLSLAQT